MAFSKSPLWQSLLPDLQGGVILIQLMLSLAPEPDETIPEDLWPIDNWLKVCCERQASKIKMYWTLKTFTNFPVFNKPLIYKDLQIQRFFGLADNSPSGCTVVGPCNSTGPKVEFSLFALF